MLTKYDDYPVHQTSDPIAYAGTDRNYYDRYWFNGYSRDGSVFFSAAFGVYPNLNIMDGTFSVVSDGVQHNVRVSRHMNMERMHTVVGPLEVEVVEPLKQLRVRLNDNEFGITADVLFSGRAPVVEEPRFTKRQGPRTVFDYTRLTQNGDYTGWIDIKGKRTDFEGKNVRGTRDRSWGVRYNVGLPDPQEVPPVKDLQAFWLWAPLNFDDTWVHFHDSQESDGTSWNVGGLVGGLGDDTQPEHMKKLEWDIVMRDDIRHLKSATAYMTDADGGITKVEFDLKWKFYMSGLGYQHPDYGHGFNKGPLAINYDTILTADIDSSLPPLYSHIQQFSEVTMTRPNGEVSKGCGVLEQAFFGDHEPTGLKGLF
ncbi:hypothetical protein G8764_04400 [Pseudomaricurvus alcaniphilus]|uniref:hypothetical protein n=1 Tax=Pseudomaricurvus alcaniphilus TaxID=1166482 RepID=UPI00140C524C|nr:hypothetical protein [Pseudomaricurvus alcaniphilus]NHN36529.1 hypothetical protein [Pseudomaricurvus alcaniphilus]